MEQDLDRIRCLQFRMRKKPVPKKDESNENEELVSESREQPKTEEEVVIRISGKMPPKQILEAHSLEQAEGQIAEDSLNKKDRKITEFFGPGKRSGNAVVKPMDLKKHPAKDSKSSQKTQGMNSNAYLCLQDQNRNLRERLKQKQEQFTAYKKKLKDMTINYVIRNHQYQRQQIKSRVSGNRVRLGQYVLHKENAKITQSWVDGQEIKSLKGKLDDILARKEELQTQKKAQKSQIGADTERYDVVCCQLLMLGKDEATLRDLLQKLEDQKSVHIKDYKRLFEEENSKYSKPNSSEGVSAWPNIKSYQMLCLLGKGGFSQVYKAFDTQELREVACKIHEFDLRWADEAKDNYIRHSLRENVVHKLLKHPHIVSLYNTVQIDRTSFMTVMEYCDGPDLSYYLRKHKCIPERESKLLIRQVLSAIKYMHQLEPEKVIHYDLKPQNIIFHMGVLKVTDFGLCKIMKDGNHRMQLTSQGVGTYWYLPPECFTDSPTITTKVDIWSIGVIYYQMLFHQKPFGHNMSQMRILKQKIIINTKNVALEFPSKPQVSQESKDFITACLRYNQADRMTAEQALQHRLFAVR